MDKKTLALILIALLFVLIYISEISISFTPATYINATSILGIGFTSDSGNNTDLINLFDNSSWNGSETGGSPWNIYITYYNVTTFDYIETVVKYNSTGVAPSAHEVVTSAWCVANNEWVEFDDMNLDLEYHYKTKRVINASHFIFSNGTVFIKMTHADNGNAAHRIWIDQFRLVIIPQFGQTTINNYNITSSGGTGCTGNCSFDGVWTNSLRKNDTFDIYGDYINLSAPFGKQSDVLPIFSFFTLNDGEFYSLQSTNSTSGDLSNVFGNPEQIRLSVTNGDANTLSLGQGFLRYTISGTTSNYTLNQTHMDYGGANITGLNTTTATGSIFEKRNNAMIGSLSFIDLTPGGTGGINRTLSLFGLNRIYNEQSLSWTNGTYSSAPGAGFVIDSQNITLGNYPSMKMFYFMPNSTSFSYWFSSTANKTEVLKGNLSINTAGSGITMYSPDGNDWCVTVSNAGALTVSATPCT